MKRIDSYGYGSDNEKIKLSQEIPVMVEKLENTIKKATDFSQFAKLYTPPVSFDKNTFVNLSITKNKSKQDVIVYIYDISKNDKIPQIENNIKELCSIKHANLVSFNDVFVKVPKNEFGKYQFHLVTSHASNSNPRNLDNLIYESSKTKQKQYFSQDLIALWLHNALSALHAIHSKGITHNNLTTSSFLMINNDSDIKIGSFGFGAENLLDFVTQSFIAPECYDDKIFTSASDVYALGVTFLKVMTLKDLDVSQMDQGEILKEIPSRYKDSEFVKLIVSMVSEDASKRPKVKEMMDQLQIQVEEVSKKEGKGGKKDVAPKVDIESIRGDFIGSQMIQQYSAPKKNTKEREVSRGGFFGLLSKKSSAPPPERDRTEKSSDVLVSRMRESSVVKKEKKKSTIKAPKDSSNEDSSASKTEEEKVSPTSSRSLITQMPPPPPKTSPPNQTQFINAPSKTKPSRPMESNTFSKSIQRSESEESDGRMTENTEQDEDSFDPPMSISMLDDVSGGFPEKEFETMKMEQDEAQQQEKEEDEEAEILIQEPPTPLTQSINQRVIATASLYASDDAQLTKTYNLIRDAQQVAKLKKSSKPYEEQAKKLELELSQQNTPLLLKRFFAQTSEYGQHDLLTKLDRFYNEKQQETIQSTTTSLSEDLPEIYKSEKSDQAMESMSYKSHSKKKSFSFDLFSCLRSSKAYEESGVTEDQLEEAIQEEMKYGKIRKENYQATERIGEGGSATIFLVRSKENQELYIMKVFNAGADGDAAQEIAAFADFKERRLHSDHVVQFREHFSYFDEYDSCQQIVIMEYCEDRDLARITKKRGKAHFFLSEQEILHIMIQVYDGLEYLHDKGYIHRDIKPENIFVKKNRLIKIGDFGFALKKGSTVDKVFGGTPKYMSPEQFENVHEIGTEFMDIWAAGCVFLELMTRKVRDMKMEVSANPTWLDEIWQKDDLVPRYSPQIKALLLRCFLMNPMERSSAKEMKENLVMLKMQHVNGTVIQSSMRGCTARLNYKCLMTQREENPNNEQ